MQISSRFFNQALNLKHTVLHSAIQTTRRAKFAGVGYDQKVIEITGRPNVHWQHKCPHCMKSCSIYDHQSGSVSWRTGTFNGEPVYLVYEPARISCPEHGVVREYLPWVCGRSWFTLDFCFEVAWAATVMPKSAVCAFYQISWQAVGNCIKIAHDYLEPDISRRLEGLRRICIDETSYSKGYKYLTVVYDMDRCRVVWISDGNGLEIYRKFCLTLTEEQRAGIEIVAGDGARWIDSGTEEFFPNAHRCIDPFHLVGWANEALDEVRSDAVREARQVYAETERRFMEGLEVSAEALEKAEAELEEAENSGDTQKAGALKNYIKMIKDLNDGKKVKRINRLRNLLTPEQQEVLKKLKTIAKELKNARYAVGKNPENRTENQEEKLKVIEANSPTLYKGYELKEEIRQISHMSDVKSAEAELDRWVEKARNSGIPAFVRLAEKIVRHRENLLNTIRYGANSSQSESCNAKIKRIIRRAHGFRNLDNLSAMIYLECSDLVIPLPHRPQLTAEQIAENRRRAREYRQRREEARRNAHAA
jgi:transposase